MEIKIKDIGENITVKVIGRLDTETSPALETRLKEIIGNSPMLTFDFSELDYISSSGLRILLGTQKKINSLGLKLKIFGINSSVKDIFEITGMINLFDMEN